VRSVTSLNLEQNSLRLTGADDIPEKANTMRANAMPDLGRRLLTLEAAESRDQEALIEAAERASDKLRAHLSRRIGQEGFRTLLARALTLTTAQFPQLSVVRVGADGSLVGLRAAMSNGSGEARDTGTPEDAVEGVVALVAQLLTLLLSFIGEDLTLRLLGAVWPELATRDATDQETGRP